MSQISASSAAASATAVVSEPPRPSVVSSRSGETPWKPATIAIRPASSASRTRYARISTIRALPCVVSVTIPACDPVNETASLPRSLIAIDRSAIEIRSPAVSSMSRSRGCGLPETCVASSSSSSVVSPIAETTTHTWSPFAAAPTTRRATSRIRSGSATDEPPYFWTTRLTDQTLREGKPGDGRERIEARCLDALVRDREETVAGDEGAADRRGAGVREPCELVDPLPGDAEGDGLRLQRDDGERLRRPVEERVVVVLDLRRAGSERDGIQPRRAARVGDVEQLDLSTCEPAVRGRVLTDAEQQVAAHRVEVGGVAAQLERAEHARPRRIGEVDRVQRIDLAERDDVAD